jgi:MOSC domain-containing protein YiiM
LSLPRGTLLLGDEAIVVVTGLRNPCAQLDDFQPGLLAAVVDRKEKGGRIRKAGIRGIVRAGGVSSGGDAIRLTLSAMPQARLERV